ncbi:MAG: alginate lyase family protein [Nevskia sp.]|nr:alginate lyase family protein [Nevskia sp.]
MNYGRLTIAGFAITIAATTACRSDQRPTEPLPATASSPAASGSASDARLRAPGQFAMAPVGSKKRGGGDCDASLRPFTSALDFPSKYEGSGKSRDTLNTDADRRYKAAMADLSTLETTSVKVVGRYLQNGDAAGLACIVKVLDNWAQADALLGPAPEHTGRAVRKWVLASISAAYLRLKLSPTAPLAEFADQEKHIDAWLRKLGNRVVAEWPTDVPLNKVNNHYYWTAWALVATGTALNDRALFEYGLRIYRIFESQVGNDGVLQNELNRKSRALEYHVYALGPLAMVAAFANANGYPVDVSPTAPLSRLAALSFSSLGNPDILAGRAGARQETFDSAATNYAWMEPYCYVAQCPDAMQQQLASVRPLSSTRMGGNLTQIFDRRTTP